MLFINRRCSPDTWGVYDTDDNTETEVSEEQLRSIIRLGIEIKGVDVRTVRYSVARNAVSHSVEGISTYQDPRTVTTAQTKMKVMNGVDIKVWNNHIVGIEISDVPYSGTLYVRLSDFAKECDDYVFNEFNIVSNLLFFVLDDKIKLNKNSLHSVFTLGEAGIDIRECNNLETIKYVYQSWVYGHIYGCDLDMFILDRLERQDKYRLVERLYGSSSALQRPRPSDEASAMIWELFRTDFISFMRQPINMPGDGSFRRYAIQSFANETIVSRGKFWRSRCKDYTKVAAAFGSTIDIMSEYFNWDKEMTRVLNNFIGYFKVPEEFMKEYVHMCNRLCNLLLDLVGYRPTF